MAKFIKFRIDNAEALTGGSGQRDVLLDVSKIESISDIGAATSVVITLSEYVGLEAGHADGATVPAGTVGGRILTLTLGTNTASAPIGGGAAIVAPTVPSVYQNMPSQSINKALTANPGGVSSQVQLALDGAGVRGTDSQMYFVQASFSSSNTI
jgi:hypothetical protein